ASMSGRMLAAQAAAVSAGGMRADPKATATASGTAGWERTDATSRPGRSVFQHLLDGARVGVHDDGHAGGPRVLFVVGDVPGRVPITRRRRRLDHHRVSLREKGLTILLGEREELRSVAEELGFQIRDASCGTRL